MLSSGRHGFCGSWFGMTLKLANAAVIGDELALSFEGGIELYLALPLLRRACPCATCQGEPDAMGRIIKPKIEYGPKAFELIKLDIVGGYALQPTWGDGHNTGIYSFDYLSKLHELPES